MKLFSFFCVCGVASLFVGCASVGGEAFLDETSIKTDGEPSKSQLIVSVEGVRGSSNGIAPSGFLLDGSGAFAGMTGPAGLFNINRENGTVNIVSPNDAEMMLKNLRVEESPTTGTLLVADEFRLNIRISENIEQQVLSYEAARDVIVQIAPEQRLEGVQTLEAAGLITQSIAIRLIEELALR